jgi:hypothetical protein
METRVVGLYVHGDRGTELNDTAPIPMLPIAQSDCVVGMGLRADRRYFQRPDPGRPRKRQVSLIDEGTIARHEARFGPINRAFIKAQIILAGEVHLPSLVGHRLDFEDGAELTVSLLRQPCYAMDLIYDGLRRAMQDGEQGALAMVTRDGVIAVGQSVRILQRAAATPGVAAR